MSSPRRKSPLAKRPPLVRPIVVVPKGCLFPEIRQQLIEAGYVPIEGEPDKIKVIQTLQVSPTSSDMVMRALLLMACDSDATTFTSRSRDFGKHLLNMLREGAR